ncbi:MAG: ATP-binding protein [Burkholderiales bacterium]|nr:ATP-binding protein [Burkholderiales bacterium]
MSNLNQAPEKIQVVQAKYSETGVKRFKGNPFIEALPPLPASKSDFLTLVANYPDVPTDKDRRKGEIVRLMELQTLNDLVYPFPAYQKIALALATMLPETYVARNPLDVTDVKRRHALAARESDGVLFPKNWKTSAKGHLLIAISGMGKSTLASAFFLQYPQIIQHTVYQGKPLKHVQIVYLMLRAPHDGSLKSLCIQFFEAIDRLLGTNYTRQARGVRQIGLMVQLMNQVATVVSLGFIVIDEVQNLRSARGGNAEFVLNLFSEIVEGLGISILVIATPAVQPVIENSVRNSRKLASFGETTIKPMGKRDPLWAEFCEVQWDYSYVKKKGTLTQGLRDAWHDFSAGNTAFASLAFALAQRNEIGGREVVDEVAFERVAKTDMAFLQPAIRALRSKNEAALRAFDDLLFSKRYRELRKSLGIAEEATKSSAAEEFEDIPEDDLPPQATSQSQKKRRPKANASEETDLPTEDPLAM